ELTYLDFLANWNTSKRDGTKWTRWGRQAKPRVLYYFPRYSSNRQHDQYDDFCRVKLMLAHPHRDPNQLRKVNGVEYASYALAAEFCYGNHQHPDDYYGTPNTDERRPDPDQFEREFHEPDLVEEDWLELARQLPDCPPSQEAIDLLGRRDIDIQYDWTPHVGRYADPGIVQGDYWRQRIEQDRLDMDVEDLPLEVRDTLNPEQRIVYDTFVGHFQCGSEEQILLHVAVSRVKMLEGLMIDAPFERASLHYDKLPDGKNSSTPVKGRKVSIGDEEVESELSELASTIHSPSGVDFNVLEDEIIVGARTNGARKSCPLRPASDPEDETMVEADDSPVASHYPKLKRTSVFHELNESKMEPAIGETHLALLRDLKHAVIGFIDIRERLRTRIQPTTIAGETISDEYPLPPRHGGIWVAFERIVFLKHLIGLNHLQVKEYVKISTDSMGIEETEAEQVAAKTAAVKEAMCRAKLNPTAENATNPPQIAYGVEPPDHLEQSRYPKRRRRTSEGFNPINTIPSNGPVIEHTPIKPAPDGPQPGRNVIYPLPGPRPTRILLGHWAKSDEPDPKNRHAVYGILGQNGMFGVKLVRETRDGRLIDGTFPTGAGALWIAYEEVAFEPHLRSLARNEVKEYCRVRQWQIDRGDTAEEKTANETKAVYEAQARVAGTNYKAPTPLSIAPALPRQPDDYVEETDQTGRLGFGGHELRQSRRVEAARAEARPARQVLVEVDTPQPPPVPRPATSRTPQSNSALERTSALAEREITRVELAQEQ
ncbi:hypothetical protein BFJ66_g17640, partial [Fusarium oxysporum f. sp. cepae]